MICFNPNFVFGAYSHRQPPRSRWMRRFALLTRTIPERTAILSQASLARPLPFLIAFCIGVAAALAWQSHGFRIAQ